MPQVCRFLISLAPADDPMGALLCFDYYCLRASGAEPAELLLPFVRTFPAQRLLRMPSYAYSCALAQYLADKKKVFTPDEGSVTLPSIASLASLVEPTAGVTAEDLLLRALALYPTFFAKLMQKYSGGLDGAELAFTTRKSKEYFAEEEGVACVTLSRLPLAASWRPCWHPLRPWLSPS